MSSRDVHVTTKDVAVGYSRKRSHIGSSNTIGRLFDVQSQEAVDVVIACFFLCKWNTV